MHFDHLRFIWGAEICCWQFNAHSTPLTDSSAIPAVGPRASQGAISAVVQNESPALGKSKAEPGREGKAQPGLLCAHPASLNGDKRGRKCGCRVALPRGSQGWGGEGRSAEGCTPWALHIRALKKVHNAREISSRFWDQFSGHRITTAGSWVCNAALQMDRLKVNNKDRFH